MASIPTGLGNLTFGGLITALVVILLGVDAYIRVMTAIKTHREEKVRRNHPVDQLEARVDDHEEKLKKDYARLNELEDGNRIMMRAMMAMLSHEINGNSIDKLRESFEEIQKYLIER